MTVSIIIAVKTWGKNLEECIARCRQLDYKDFEILVMPDEPLEELVPSLSEGIIPIRMIPTGPLSPAHKRDLALKEARGEILAFIDDDAYPPSDWLKNAVRLFRDKEVAAVGGPAVTPQEDSLTQRASGIIYASSLVSASFSYRYLPGKRREVQDYPSCNFLMRAAAMKELGGFKTNFWPGEDTKLCLGIVKTLRKKIIYDPQVLVFHHRRALFIPHLKQIASYALHRGYFVKIYPDTSFKFSYFIPSIFLLSLFAGNIAALAFPSLAPLYLAGIIMYICIVFIFSIYKELRLIPLVFSGIILTHLTYGVFFLKGLFTRKLSEG